MKDLIDRETAIDAIDEIESEIAEGIRFKYEKWRKYFCDLPSAQPERERGKWKMDLKRHVFVCSICGAWQVFNCNYCSNCGADMREVDDGQV